MAVTKAEAIEAIALGFPAEHSADVTRLAAFHWEQNPHTDTRVRVLLTRRAIALDFLARTPGTATRKRRGDTEYEYKTIDQWKALIAEIDRQLGRMEGVTVTVPISNLPNSYDPGNSAFPDDVDASGGTLRPWPNRTVYGD